MNVTSLVQASAPVFLGSVSVAAVDWVRGECTGRHKMPTADAKGGDGESIAKRCTASPAVLKRQGADSVLESVEGYTE